MLNFVLFNVSWWDNYKEERFSQDGAPPHLLLLAFAKFRTYPVSLMFCRDRSNRELPTKTNQNRLTGKTNSMYFCLFFLLQGAETGNLLLFTAT